MLLDPVLPTGRNFCRKTQNYLAHQKSQWPRKSVNEFSADLPKNGKKGAKLF
jgi:hypothetical protein